MMEHSYLRLSFFFFISEHGYTKKVDRYIIIKKRQKVVTTKYRFYYDMKLKKLVFMELIPWFFNSGCGTRWA